MITSLQLYSRTMENVAQRHGKLIEHMGSKLTQTKVNQELIIVVSWWKSSYSSSSLRFCWGLCDFVRSVRRHKLCGSNDAKDQKKSSQFVISHSLLSGTLCSHSSNLTLTQSVLKEDQKIIDSTALDQLGKISIDAGLETKAWTEVAIKETFRSAAQNDHDVNTKRTPVPAQLSTDEVPRKHGQWWTVMAKW